MSSWQYFTEELKGVYSATAEPMVNTVEHPVDTVTSAVSDAYQGVKDVIHDPKGTLSNAASEAKDEAVQFGSQVASGDPRAIGQVVGVAATIAYTAENVRVRAYENTGGGGLNIRNTPTTGSSIRFDIHPIEEGGGYRPHIDITIKKPGVPSGPGSNAIRPIRHWPW